MQSGGYERAGRVCLVDPFYSFYCLFLFILLVCRALILILYSHSAVPQTSTILESDRPTLTYRETGIDSDRCLIDTHFRYHTMRQ